MSNLKYLALLFICSFSYASHASVTVGSCKPSDRSYPTISAAIAEASPGEVIEVCSGTYAEQLKIDKPLSIRGIGDVTLIFPPHGLAPIHKRSGTYSQVLVHNIDGPVKLSYISIEGGDRFESPFGGESSDIAGQSLCLSGYLEDYSGILSLGPSTDLDHVKVLHHRIVPVTGGTRLVSSQPYCGGGIEFRGDEGMVRNSLVDGFGAYGIRGVAIAEHNIVTGASGAYSIGISARGDVSNNTVTGPGYGKPETIGIQSSKPVKENVVQLWATGISGPIIRENHLRSNEVGLTKINEVSGNVILASATYPNLACAQPGVMCTDTLPASNVPATLPTIGVDLGCSDGTSVRNNRIEGVSIGFADVHDGKSAPQDNSLTGVLTASKACSH